MFVEMFNSALAGDPAAMGGVAMLVSIVLLIILPLVIALALDV